MNKNLLSILYIYKPKDKYNILFIKNLFFKYYQTSYKNFVNVEFSNLNLIHNDNFENKKKYFYFRNTDYFTNCIL